MIYQFESYALDVGRQELRRGSERVPVDRRFSTFLSISSATVTTSSARTISSRMSGTAVSCRNSTLTSRITAARQAIGDCGEDQRLIRTVARKGIRFVGDVSENPNTSPALSEALPPDAAPPVSHGPLVPRLPDKPSIAVLPFTNMSGDPEQEYFSDGITEDIITALSRLRWFFVISRNSTFVYKGHAVDVKQVGRDLGVRYVLEGSVRKSGQRVRITSQLLDGVSGNHIWSERYDRELTDIFALQDEITASVTSAIEPKLLAAEGLRTEARSTDDLDAWDLVARALSHFWKLTATDSAAAISILRQAVQRHPTYAPAHSMLAFAIFVSGYVGWIPAGTERDFAAQLASRAAELDDSDPWAHLALGYKEFTGRHTEEAIRHFSNALDLNPNFAAAAGSIGFALALDGRSDEAIRHFEQALRMSPRDPFNAFFFVGIAVAQYQAGRYPDAIKWARQAVQLRPGYIGGHRILAASLAQAGQTDEAKAATSALLKSHPDITITHVRQGVPYTSGPMEKFIDGLRKAGMPE